MNERCQRCGFELPIPHQRRVVEMHVLCNRCINDLLEAEDRLNVLEGFLETINRLAEPVRKV